MLENSRNIEIGKLKEILNGKFEMKDFDEVKRIMGMVILRNRRKSELFISLSSYLKKWVKWFIMQDAKTLNILLDHYTKLLVKKCTQIEEDKKVMKNTTYISGTETLCMV